MFSRHIDKKVVGVFVRFRAPLHMLKKRKRIQWAGIIPTLSQMSPWAILIGIISSFIHIRF
jgi:hypothetical protein